MNYQNGKIYCIRSHQTDDIYIGSTCSPLHKRFYQHKKNYRKWKNEKYNYTSSFEILQYKDVYIELLEEYPCNNKMELHKKEGEHIRSMNCVNKKKPYITEEERKENRIKNNKIRYENNKDEINKKNKKYYEENKEKWQKWQKQYRKQKVLCVCGSNIPKYQIRRHERSKKHIKYIESL